MQSHTTRALGAIFVGCVFDEGLVVFVDIVGRGKIVLGQVRREWFVAWGTRGWIGQELFLVRELFSGGANYRADILSQRLGWPGL